MADVSIWHGAGAPTRHRWQKDDIAIDNTGAMFRCTKGGEPGTWEALTPAGSGGSGASGHRIIGPFPWTNLSPNLGTTGFDLWTPIGDGTEVLLGGIITDNGTHDLFLTTSGDGGQNAFAQLNNAGSPGWATDGVHWVGNRPTCGVILADANPVALWTFADLSASKSGNVWLILGTITAP